MGLGDNTNYFSKFSNDWDNELMIEAQQRAIIMGESWNQ